MANPIRWLVSKIPAFQPQSQGANVGWGLSDNFKSLAFIVNENGDIQIQPICVVDPNTGAPVNTTGTAGVGSGTVNGSVDNESNAQIALLVESWLKAFNGSSWDKLRTSAALDAKGISQVLAISQMAPDQINGSPLAKQAIVGVNASLSAVATANVLKFDLHELKDHLSIITTCSAGTATLALDFSVDNATWITGISLAAAATQTIDLIGGIPLSSTTAIAATDVSNPITSGGAVTITTDLNPLAFRYIRVTAGTAGAGNTTTTTVSAK